MSALSLAIVHNSSEFEGRTALSVRAVRTIKVFAMKHSGACELR